MSDGGKNWSVDSGSPEAIGKARPSHDRVAVAPSCHVILIVENARPSCVTGAAGHPYFIPSLSAIGRMRHQDIGIRESGLPSLGKHEPQRAIVSSAVGVEG